MVERANILGDPRAEHDKEMLASVFLETADYRTLLESNGDRCLVVGRRGTGKSALAYRLKLHWRSVPKAKVASLSPDEDQMIGLRHATKFFGEDFKKLRAGARVIWKYAFLMEAATLLLAHHKSQKSKYYSDLLAETKEWNKHKHGVAERVRKRLQGVVDLDSPVDARIGELATSLNLRDIDNGVQSLIEETGCEVHILIDKLDEGYEPDDVGVAIIDGIAQAAIDLNSQIKNLHIVVFLRDNIYRTLSQKDPDFSRNIEGQTLRLHWDEVSLFNMVSYRIRMAFNLDAEDSLKIWNRVVARDLIGREGFRKCLRLTLYRPRDLLILLNDAFFFAKKAGRDTLVDEDVEATAKQISNNRFEDLKKEYEAIIPGIGLFLAKFKNGDPERSVADVVPLIDEILYSDVDSAAVAQQLALFDGSLDVIRGLYSIGFAGIRDERTDNFVFCHDGRQPDYEFVPATRLLVHPCYWMALNLTKDALDPDDAQEIHDDYDIEVSSDNPVQRAKRIGQIEQELVCISEGREDAGDFEDWCLTALKIIFAGSLSNIEKKPNGANKNRRDIVGTNLKSTDSWRRVRDDFGTTQVVFEVKNYKDLTLDDYRQLLSYLNGQYGGIGFLICRDNEINLKKGKDLDWMRDIHRDHGVVIVKLTAKWLIGNLHKLRSPQKHNAPDKALGSLLDQYQRMYLSGS